MALRRLGDHTRKLLSGLRTSRILKEAAILEGIGELSDEMIAVLRSLDPEESPESVVLVMSALVKFANGEKSIRQRSFLAQAVS